MRFDAIFRLIFAVFFASLPLLLAIKRGAQRRRDAQQQLGTDGDIAADGTPETSREEPAYRDRQHRQPDEPSRRLERRSRPGRLREFFRTVMTRLENAWDVPDEFDQDLREPTPTVSSREIRAARPTARPAVRSAVPGGPGTQSGGGKIRLQSPLHKESRGFQGTLQRQPGDTTSPPSETVPTAATAAEEALRRVESRPTLQRAILYQDILGAPRALSPFIPRDF